MGPFGMTNQRETVCDFSDAFYSENNAILMVRPTLQHDMAGFAKPFKKEVRKFKGNKSVRTMTLISLPCDNNILMNTIRVML